METSDSPVQACRNCRHFTPEGRRGGSCHLLSALVKGSWKACSMAIPAFTSDWENLEEVFNLQQGSMLAPVTVSLNSRSVLERSLRNYENNTSSETLTRTSL
ncbi:MAG: hypothetical protein KME16_01335 [Scytolyngbya sp. HA4215-MV1]|nr:hypothetical protein [Scytolyngbya sp. HA4215-MV1]